LCLKNKGFEQSATILSSFYKHKKNQWLAGLSSEINTIGCAAGQKTNEFSTA
jgi:hypothetical protein